MQETLETIIPTPTLTLPLHRLLASTIGLFLSYGAIITGFTVWLLSSWYVALFIIFFSYLVLGILSSKILHLCVPPAQRERDYSTFEIARWYVSYLFMPVNS